MISELVMSIQCIKDKHTKNRFEGLADAIKMLYTFGIITTEVKKDCNNKLLKDVSKKIKEEVWDN